MFLEAPRFNFFAASSHFTCPLLSVEETQIGVLGASKNQCVGWARDDGGATSGIWEHSSAYAVNITGMRDTFTGYVVLGNVEDRDWIALKNCPSPSPSPSPSPLPSLGDFLHLLGLSVGKEHQTLLDFQLSV